MYTFDPHTNPNIIYLVGLGGTGGYLAGMVGRILYDMQRRSLKTPTLCLVDDDQVEKHNVGRQQFSPADVGLYKAEIIGRRLNFALGLDVRWRTEKYNAQWIERRHEVILLGAVDSAEGRGAMSESGALWIDSGNHFDSGQVIIGNTDDKDRVINHGFKRDEKTLRHLPYATVWHPELLEGEPEPEPDASCADLLAAGDQHLLINQMVATVASNYLYKVLNRQPINSYMTIVDLELGMVQPKFIDEYMLESIA